MFSQRNTRSGSVVAGDLYAYNRRRAQNAQQSLAGEP